MSKTRHLTTMTKTPCICNTTMKTPHNYNTTMKTPHNYDTTMKRVLASAALLLALGVSCKAQITLCTICPCLPEIDATSCKIAVDYGINSTELRCDETVGENKAFNDKMQIQNDKLKTKPTLTVNVTGTMPTQGILIMFDPDIPNNYDVELGWMHWVARVDIDPATGVLTEDTSKVFLKYNGPTPPQGSGVHRYQLFLYPNTDSDLSTAFSNQDDREKNICDIIEAYNLPAPIVSSQFRFESPCKIDVVYPQLSRNKLICNEQVPTSEPNYNKMKDKPTLTVNVADFPHNQGILIMYDPDIPRADGHGWMHWVVRVNVDQTTGVLTEVPCPSRPETGKDCLPYKGPEPPMGHVHRYQLFLYQGTDLSATTFNDRPVTEDRKMKLRDEIVDKNSLGEPIVSSQFRFQCKSGKDCYPDDY